MKEKIRVLYICSHKDLGGASQSMLDMVEACGDMVEPVVLLPAIGDMSNVCKERGYQYIIHDFVDLAFLTSYSWKRIIKRPWNIRWVRYICRDLKCIVFLRNVLSLKEIDIVHSNVSGCTVGVWISLLWNKPHVWHIREALDLHFQSDICGGMKRLRYLVNKSDARIAISSAIKSYWGMVDNGTFVINDVVRRSEESVLYRTKEKYFLFASFFLTESKGAPLAVEAFSLSRVFEMGYRLKLVGNCDETSRRALLQIAQKYNCEQFVDFIPFQYDVKPLFSKATAFIQASKYEGFGRTTAEAMFFGCPVIASAYSGGTLDLIQNNTTGFLFNDVNECAAIIRKIIDCDNTHIIDAAQKFAISNLVPEVYKPKLLSVYDYVCGK